MTAHFCNDCAKPLHTPELEFEVLTMVSLLPCEICGVEPTPKPPYTVSVYRDSARSYLRGLSVP